MQLIKVDKLSISVDEDVNSLENSITILFTDIIISKS